MCDHYKTHMEVPKELIMFTDFLNNLDPIIHHNIIRQNSIYTLIFKNINDKINNILNNPINNTSSLDYSDKHIKPTHTHEHIKPIESCNDDKVELHKPSDPRIDCGKINNRYSPYDINKQFNKTTTDIFYFKCILYYNKVYDQFYIYKPGSKLGQQKDTYMNKIINKLEIEPSKIIEYDNTRIDYYLVDNIDRIDVNSHSDGLNNIEILFNNGKVNCIGSIVSYNEILDLYNTGSTNNIFVSICKSIDQISDLIKK